MFRRGLWERDSQKTIFQRRFDLFTLCDISRQLTFTQGDFLEKNDIPVHLEVAEGYARTSHEDVRLMCIRCHEGKTSCSQQKRSIFRSGSRFERRPLRSQETRKSLLRHSSPYLRVHPICIQY